MTDQNSIYNRIKLLNRGGERELNVVAHAYNTTPQEVEVGG